MIKTENQPTIKSKYAVKTIFSYKSALFLFDFCILFAVAYLGILSVPLETIKVSDYPTTICLFTILTSTLFFFSILKLYSYHLIYSVRFHLFALVQAFGFTSIAAALLFLIIRTPEHITDIFLIPAIVVITLGIVILDRYKWENSINLLYPIGFALLQLAFLELAGGVNNSTGLIKWPVIGAVVFLSSVMLITLRLFLVHYVFNHLLRKKFRRQVLIVGADESASQFTNHIITLNAPFWIVGAIGLGTESDCINSQIAQKGCIGRLNDLPQVVDDHNISDIVVTAEDISKRLLIDLLDYCTSRGINAWFSPRLLPIIDVKLYIDRFCGAPMIRLCSQKNTWLFNKMKHGFDALVTIPAFILQLPLFTLIAATVKIDSKGPFFYKAQAVGRNGKTFSMYKFRSMRIDTDAGIHKDYVTRLIAGQIESEKSVGPLKITDDPRVTSVGRIIRKLSLDELPQLINVLKGEMSLVGPRPCLTYEYDVYQDWHKKRTVVRPGITGLWQVTGRSEVTFEDMILLDLYYIYNRNLLLDLQILYETVFVVLGKRGAY